MRCAKDTTMKNKIALPPFLALMIVVSTCWAGTPQEPSPESQQEFEMIVPEGTVIPIVLTAYLNTRSSQVGDIFYADTTYPVWIQQRLVIPKGSTIRGTVTEVVKPGRIKGKGRLAVRFDDIMLPNGVKREFIATFRGIHGAGDEKIDRKSETVSAGSSSNGEEVGTVVGTTSTGAIIGAVTGHGVGGAVIGGGVGAAAGIVTVLATRDRQLVLSPGTQFDLELKKPLKFAYNELSFTDAELNNAHRVIQTAPRSQTRRRLFGVPGILVPIPIF